MRSTSNGKTTFAYKLKMLARAISSSQLRLNAARVFSESWRNSAAAVTLKKRTLTHGCAPLPFFFFLLPVHSRNNNRLRAAKGSAEG